MTTTVFAISTTGLPNFHRSAADPGQPRIIAVAAHLFSPKWVEQGAFHGITRAEDGVSSAEARAVHGITERERELYGIEIRMLMSYLMRFIRHSKEVACFNIGFVKFMIDIELHRLDADARDWNRGGMQRTCLLEEAGRRYNAGRVMTIQAAHDAAVGIEYHQPERAKHVYDARAAARMIMEMRRV